MSKETIVKNEKEFANWFKNNYKKYCQENAIMLSKKIELFMKKELEETK